MNSNSYYCDKKTKPFKCNANRYFLICAHSNKIVELHHPNCYFCRNVFHIYFHYFYLSFLPRLIINWYISLKLMFHFTNNPHIEYSDLIKPAYLSVNTRSVSSTRASFSLSCAILSCNPLLSVDPSLISISSYFSYVYAKIESTHILRYFSTLYTGTMILTIFILNLLFFSCILQTCQPPCTEPQLPPIHLEYLYLQDCQLR